jgi:hypothetical protein
LILSLLRVRERTHNTTTPAVGSGNVDISEVSSMERLTDDIEKRDIDRSFRRKKD